MDSRSAQRWQEEWARAGIATGRRESGRGKFYALIAYPGASGFLHVGHLRAFAYADALHRFHRALGESVLFPFGLHASGLPAVTWSRRVKARDPTVVPIPGGCRRPSARMASPRGAGRGRPLPGGRVPPRPAPNRRPRRREHVSHYDRRGLPSVRPVAIADAPRRGRSGAGHVLLLGMPRLRSGRRRSVGDRPGERRGRGDRPIRSRAVPSGRRADPPCGDPAARDGLRRDEPLARPGRRARRLAPRNGGIPRRRSGRRAADRTARRSPGPRGLGVPAARSHGSRSVDWEFCPDPRKPGGRAEGRHGGGDERASPRSRRRRRAPRTPARPSARPWVLHRCCSGSRPGRLSPPLKKHCSRGTALRRNAPCGPRVPRVSPTGRRWRPPPSDSIASSSSADG